MTIDEVKIILRIMLTADNGCSVCTRNLFDEFIEKFPEFENIANQIFKTEMD